MDYIMLEAQVVVAFLCIMGCGWSSWKIGHQAGIISALEYLEAEGVLTFDEEKNKA